MPAVTDTITAAVQPRTRHRKRLLVLSILTIFVFTFITFTMYRVQKVDYHGSLHSFVEQLARGQLRSSDSVDDVGLLRILEPFAVCEAGWTDASCVLENEQDPAYLQAEAKAAQSLVQQQRLEWGLNEAAWLQTPSADLRARALRLLQQNVDRAAELRRRADVAATLPLDSAFNPMLHQTMRSGGYVITVHPNTSYVQHEPIVDRLLKPLPATAYFTVQTLAGVPEREHSVVVSVTHLRRHCPLVRHNRYTSGRLPCSSEISEVPVGVDLRFVGGPALSGLRVPLHFPNEGHHWDPVHI